MGVRLAEQVGAKGPFLGGQTNTKNQSLCSRIGGSESRGLYLMEPSSGVVEIFSGLSSRDVFCS